MPLFTVNVAETIGKHELDYKFLSKIESSDILVISMAENNRNYSVSFKNIFD